MLPVPLAAVAVWQPCLLDLATTLPAAKLKYPWLEASIDLRCIGSAVLRAVGSLIFHIRNPAASSLQLESGVDAVCDMRHIARMPHNLHIPSLRLTRSPD